MYSVALVVAENTDRRNKLRIYRQQLRDATDPFSIPEKRFRDLYRLSRDAALVLYNNLSPYMSKGVKKTFIPQPLRMCAALHFFASGSFYRDAEDFNASVSKSVVSRCVQEVADILERKLMHKWIRFPSVSEYEALTQRFYEETGFTGVIGVVDCTHVRIKKPPPEVEDCYLNRMGYYSKNVQLICDYDLNIIGGYARFGGSTHATYIWEASRINALLQQRYECDRNNHAWLLGDLGYPLRPWLITPYRSSTGDGIIFNETHAKARNCAKRLNGVLKTAFRCLQVGLHTTPQMAGKIINACTVLHNFRREHGLIQENFEIIEEDNNFELNEETNEPLSEAYLIRDRLKNAICQITE